MSSANGPGGVSSHADRIQARYIDELVDKRDALLAENQRLRDALERIKREAGNEGFVCSRVAREALAGDAA